ncbi:MAG: hypothetical protein AVDCRST_MAG91-1317, partial [uncultured Sphingomonadaceae bacterium]
MAQLASRVSFFRNGEQSSIAVASAAATGREK